MEEKKLDELGAKLEIYKSTLTEIYERYDQKLEELSLVRRVGDALRTTLTVESLASALMATVAHEVVVDRLALLLKVPEDDQELYLRAAYWADKEEFQFFDEQAKKWSMTGLGLKSGGEMFNLKTLTHIKAELEPLGSSEEDERTLVLLPLLVRHRLLGLLVLSRPDGQPFSPENEHMLSIMADQASSALSNVLLFDDLSRTNTKLVQSERRARESSEYLEQLLETANDAILILDSAGRITYSNRKVGQWGWGKEELAGSEFRSFLEDNSILDWPGGQPPPVDRILEATLINAAGDRRVVMISTSSVGTDGDSGPYGTAGPSFMIMVSDITERRQLEGQLLHSEKLASIGLLAAGVAHEVGNPLSAISGYAQLLETGVSDDERREYIKAILNQTGRIQKILRELLDYSRPSRGLNETLDLAEHLPRIMSMLEAQRGFNRIQVVYELDEVNSPHLVNMDRDHLAQVVIIIAMNAAQAMNAQVEPAPRFSVELAREHGFVIMKLSDNGPGMSAEVRRRVFDPFFTTKGPGQGTGLGLAICQRIVDSYRGRLELLTAEGQGAAFILRWPEGEAAA